MGRHKFTKTPIPDEEERVIEICTKGCGTTAYRDKKGQLVYINPKTGNILGGNNTPKCLGETILPQPEVREYLELKTTNIVPSGNTNRASIRNIDTINKGLTQEEATLKDALTIMQLMFEDLIKNNIHTHSRRMAGIFLHSQNYTEVVKKIESKTS